MRKQFQQAKIVIRLFHQQRKGVILLGLISSGMKTILSYLPLWCTSIIVNLFLEGTREQLFLIVGVMVGSILCIQCLQTQVEYRFQIAVKQLELQLETSVSEKAMHLSYDKLEDKQTLDLIEKAKGGINQNGGIIELCSQIACFMQAIFSFLIAIGLLTYLLFSKGETSQGILAIVDSYWMGFALLLCMIIYAMFGKHVSKGFEKAGMSFFEKNAKLSREAAFYTNEVALNHAMAKDIRIFGMQDAILEEMENRQKKSHHFFGEFNHTLSTLFSQSLFIGYAMNGIYYMYVVCKVFLKAIPLGDFVTYSASIEKLNDAIGSIAPIYTDICMLFSYMMYYDEFLSLPISKQGENVMLSKDTVISFHDVCYSYPNQEKLALDHVNLTFQPNQKTAIVGLNGAGKTTLIKLLCGLYQPQSGTICLNGTPIKPSQYHSLQQCFSVVFQDFTLFSGTLKEIICAQASDAELEDVLRRCGFQKRLETLPQGLHTLIDIQEGGIQLSGGEAQKVAIARAILANRPWVILDEPTAALDPLAEIEIYTHFNELIQDKPAIYISHRMSSCQFCDQIMVFEDGKFIQQGSHEELAKKEGLYQKLWQTQAEYYQKEYGYEG